MAQKRKNLGIESFEHPFDIWILVPALSFFDRNLRSLFHFAKGFGIGQDLSDDIDRTRCPKLLAPARRSGSEEDAEGVSGWPVSEFPRRDHFSCPCLQPGPNRNGEVDLLAPKIAFRLNGQGFPNQLGALRLVQFSLNLQITDEDVDLLSHLLLLFPQGGQ